MFHAWNIKTDGEAVEIKRLSAASIAVAWMALAFLLAPSVEAPQAARAAAEPVLTEQPRLTRGPSADTLLVSVEWTEDLKKIAQECPGEVKGKVTVGCAVWTLKAFGTASCVIWIQKPRDFNDHFRLEVLGHEIFHCAGADHAAHQPVPDQKP